jgi:transposase
VSDAAWLAQLGAHEPLRASCIPPEPVRHLRDVTVGVQDLAAQSPF